MKVLVTGSNGQLGHSVIQELRNRNIDYFASNSQSLNICDPDKVKDMFMEIKPEAVIHCAAWTDVDAAEDSSKQYEVKNINYYGTKNIVESCKQINSKLMYISTDYVFSGQGNEPWHPDETDLRPLNYYGKTKLLGENVVSNILEKYFIIRTSWIFGNYGKNFVNSMLNISKTADEVKVINDQIGTPTYVVDLSRLLVDMIETDKYGYYHATNEGGFISWYDFCCEIYNQAGINTNVIPVSTKEYVHSIAKRPLNSRLDKSKLDDVGFERLPDWKDALNRYLIEIGKISK